MEEDTQLSAARRGLLTSILLIMVLGVGSAVLAFWYFLHLGPARKDSPVAAVADASAQEEDQAPAEKYESWYPADTSAPAGTHYRPTFVPLPKGLEGVPPSMRRYIDHAFSLILQATHQRLVVYNGIGKPLQPQLLAPYLASTKAIVAKLKAEPTPKSLASFRDDVVAALELQMEWFPKAFEGRKAGQSWMQVAKDLPEAMMASEKLRAADFTLKQRFPGLPPATSQALTEHLAQLDIF